MRHLKLELCCSAASLALLLPGIAAAQTTPATAPAAATDPNALPAGGTPPRADEPGPDIVVTGSYIKGTGETTAMPVNVVTYEDMRKQGAPSTVELLKALPAASGIIGESNQFAAGRGAANEGQASVNLRGLGPERTLVLLNGKRMPTFTNFVDVNTIPASAIGRIEVLKDGAAATYGSDAVAGVVNFITRRNVSGLELSGDYRQVNGSKGDWSAGALWGWHNDRSSIMFSADVQYKSDLPVKARSWALRSFADNPQGGWTAGANPGRFVPLNGFSALNGGTAIPDPGCAALGEILTNPTPTGFSICRAQFTPWDNLIDKQIRGQFYGELRTRISDSVEFHLDGLYAITDAPTPNRSPSFTVSREVPATALPAGIPGLNTANTPATFGAYYVPGTNPGFQSVVSANPGFFPAGTNAALIPLGSFRIFLQGGNPLFDYGANFTPQRRTEMRFTSGFEGSLPDTPLTTDTSWNLDVTYGRYASRLRFRDTVTVRLQAALRGLGGPNCNFQTGTPGVGDCFWFNPFSNALPGAPALGLTNPGYNAAVANNNTALNNWMFPKLEYTITTQILNVDAGVSGATRLELPGGTVKWAAGAQLRQNYYNTKFQSITNQPMFPCADTPLNGNTNCSPQSNPLGSEAQGTPVNLRQTIKAFYGELNFPVFTSLNLNAAARYEDYGSKGGSTFNPQARAKWQALSWLAFRGSVGTTFRAPPQESVAPVTTVTNVVVFNQSIPVETTGNPNLKPEKSFSYSVGAIVEAGGFRASVDYWSYNLSDTLTAEPLANVLAASFPAAGGACSGDPAFIAAHFAFSSGCNSSTITRVKTTQINGPDVKTAGIDVIASYNWPDFMGGDLTLGGTATYIDRYSVGPLVVGGKLDPNSAFEAVGKANMLTVAYPLPQWKAQGFIDFGRGSHNLRLTARFTDSYVDQRTGLFTYSAAQQTGTIAQCGGSPPTVVSPLCGVQTAGSKIGPATLFDAAYRLKLPWNAEVTLAIMNIFDRDPPFARTELNYDSLTGDPLGRTIKIGVRKRF
jgi:iron complex outermembrane receptor protein